MKNVVSIGVEFYLRGPVGLVLRPILGYWFSPRPDLGECLSSIGRDFNAKIAPSHYGAVIILGVRVNGSSERAGEALPQLVAQCKSPPGKKRYS